MTRFIRWQHVGYHHGKAGDAGVAVAPPQPSDADVLAAMSTFHNGCDFTLHFKADGTVQLGYGCYGVHWNLAQGARYTLSRWLGLDASARAIDLKPETLRELKGRVPCSRCGGFTFEGVAVAPTEPVPPEIRQHIDAIMDEVVAALMQAIDEAAAEHRGDILSAVAAMRGRLAIILRAIRGAEPVTPPDPAPWQTLAEQIADGVDHVMIAKADGQHVALSEQALRHLVRQAVIRLSLQAFERLPLPVPPEGSR